MEQSHFILPQLDLKLITAILAASLLAAWIIPFLVDKYRLRGYPGPLLAKFSGFWLASKAYKGTTTSAVYALHQKYEGPFVRISPKYVSIADPEALQAIYGHTSGTLKTDFYDAFVTFRRNIFTSRSRLEHSRKRKYTSHAMSMKGITEFEPNVREYQHMLLKQLDTLCAVGAQGIDGVLGSCPWTTRDGWVLFDCMPWLNFDTFDVIGDLAFGKPFGMLEAGKDAALVPVSEEQAMKSFGRQDTDLKWATIPAIKLLNETVPWTFFLGCLPPQARFLMSKLPSFNAGTSRKLFVKLAVATVSKRLASEATRRDFLSHLVAARNDEGKPLSAQELTAEALNLIVGGSDTTSSSIGVVIYHVARNRDVQERLQKELDDVLGVPNSTFSTDEVVAPFELVKNLTYLQDVINEGLRLHSTVGVGLPREVPEGGMTVAGKALLPGTHVSCPTYTLHRLKSIWGDDADEFNPDRWTRGDRNMMLKYFAPFSIGPRACIGRNLAMMEMTICIATIVHRYRLVLANPDQQLECSEGFVRKPKNVHVGMQRRL
ncbi:uncharacterized protein PHACADRAFT_102576 [Phanerochaete carnosa HHB-10118-sp]|uniref:Uncharacterized protein n=1 Tax=Phanerochaete carnosa (strain HHB-10118-sp) TaxID=650164 RepID=K5VKM3_PHACS|nr:uncharacterized protein PHACADRAFT_102576 [Phanerochaete carnosa HHB-10118-sp]EKM51943.1 hypothetical protein PHACADRAFT_102576 [Phanerochaete carnosa HHB-10118-sp]